MNNPSDTYHAPERLEEQLDTEIARMLQVVPNSGAQILEGALRAAGQHVPIMRIRESMERLDPVRRIFAEIRSSSWFTRCRAELLKHHDGQRGVVFARSRFP
jgi:hypothetical protein